MRPRRHARFALLPRPREAQRDGKPALGLIADAVGITKQGVADALRATGAKRGPKVDLRARVARLRRELAEAEQELAKQGTVAR